MTEPLSIPDVTEQRAMTEALNQRIRRGTRDKTVSSEGKQDYGTPTELIAAVERDFGGIVFDLAADEHNHATRYDRFSRVLYDKTFFSIEDGSLLQDWAKLHEEQYLFSGFLWLNPPFKKVTPWMEKCRDEAKRGARILTLTKASIGSKWYREIVKPNAASYILESRVTFVGQTQVFTQDLMISEWGTGKTGLGFWNWKRK